MRFRQSALLIVLAAFTLWLDGCGGSGSGSNSGGGNNPPPAVISVALSAQPPSSLATGATTNITATVANDSANKGVTWSCVPASACGSFSPTSTASGAATTYTAPPTVPASAVTVTATSVADTTKSVSAMITITAAPPPAISVALNPQPPSSLTAGANTNITAVVTNDSANKGVTWSCAPASACGSFSPASTASGAATTYTAPAAVPASAVTVTATSVADTTKSASAMITITSAGPISVSFSPQPPASIATNSTGSFTAVVSNDSANKGVTWSCAPASACGSFSSASTTSGAATTYTAPAAIPSPNTVTVTATSVADTTKSASVTVTITAVLANGTYVYHFAGYDANGRCFVVGAFTVASGVITGGEQDFSDPKSGYTNPLSSSGNSLSTVGGNIQIVLATSNTNIGVNGVETLRGTMVSSSRALISEFDAFAVGTGSIDLQMSAAAPSGGYAFVISGLDLKAPVSPLVLGGILNISGTSLVVGSSIFDYNDGGSVVLGQTFSSGSVSAPDGFGRVTFTLTPTSAAGILLTGYIVGTNQIQLVESQNDNLSDDLGGVALGQGNHTGQFSQASLANATYVYTTSGDDVHGLTTIGGTITFNSSGTVSGNLSLNDISRFVQNEAFSGGTYTVDPTGRVSVLGIAPQNFNATFNYQFYLDGNGNALQLGADTLEATAGPAYLQTASSADFEGNFGLMGGGFLHNQNSSAWGAVGPVTMSSDALTGYTDYNSEGATPATNVSLTGTESNSTGSVSLTGLDALASTSARSYAYYSVDGKTILAIEVDGNQLGLLRLETVSH